MSLKGHATGHYVAIKPDDVEKVSDGGIVLATEYDSNLKSREEAASTRGTVIDIGPDAWKAFGSDEPWAKVGDKVHFVRHASKIIEDTDDMKDGMPAKIFILVDENVIWNEDK